MFRVIYYLVPLVGALLVLIVDEISQRRHQVVQWGNAFGTLTASVAPKLLAIFTMLAGGVLLASAATPSAAGRLAWLASVLPLPVIELSHFGASLVGALLLLAAWGLARRLADAYRLAVAALAVGIVLSLLKGLDYEAAVVLAALLVALAVSREEFTRRAALLDVPFSPSWVISTLAVVGAAIGPRPVRVPATSTTGTSCGGGSTCTATCRGSCAPAPAWCSRSTLLASHG